MTFANIHYIKNAHKTYPQWQDITLEIQEKMKEYHKKLLKEG